MQTIMRNFIAFALSSLAAFSLPMLAAPSAFAAPTAAADVLVNATVTDVLGAIKQTRDRRALRRLAEEKVLPMFDFRVMTQSATGKHWRDASPTQQQALENGFRTMLVNTYVTVLSQSEVGASSVAVKPSQPQGSPDDVLVRTLVTQPGSKPVRIDYRLRDTGGTWKVNDVLIEQLSLVSIYRDSFSDIVARSGIDGLIRQIADKNGTPAGS